MDTVSVRDLSVRTVIGVHDWERAIEQTLVFSVDMVADVLTPAASDDLADALDYSAVAATITAVVREGKFRLIETAAERVAERLLADHGLAWLRLEVRKPIAAPAPYTAVITIERTGLERSLGSVSGQLVLGLVRRPCMPPSTARAVPVVAPASGLAR
jgi:dihydroneopterin aldolase